MGEFALHTKTYGNEDQRWLGNGGLPGLPCKSIVLDRSLFDLTGKHPDGSIPSGTKLGRVTATGLVGPYTGAEERTEEVWTFTEGGSGLTSWTFTWDSTTSASIDDDAVVAAVQAEADDVFGEGNVIVSGGPLATGPFTFTVDPDGDLANTDLDAPTTTPTGGTGTVVVATATAGGAETSSDGRQVLIGHLFTTVAYDRNAASTADLHAALFWDGEVIETYLPDGPVDANGKADVAGHIKYVTDVVGA